MSQPEPARIVIEADGASRGNPGPASYGVVLMNAENGSVLAQEGTAIGRATNNVAEYRGLVAGLKLVEQVATTGWVAVYALGSLSRGNGFESPRQAAETVVTCMSQSSVFYSNFTGSTSIGSEETAVDGDPAWDLTQEIRVDNPELTVEGDVVRVVVVDTGDPASYGLFVSVVPIGDQGLIAEQDAAVGELAAR